MASEIGVQKLMHTNATQAATINSSGQLIIDDGLHKSEGGAVNTSIQQGLAKAWVNFNGNGTVAIQDSLNSASITDNGTGNYTHTFTSNMNNDDWAGCGLAGFDSNTFCGATDNTWSTSQLEIYVRNTSNSTIDEEKISLITHGDLA